MEHICWLPDQENTLTLCESVAELDMLSAASAGTIRRVHKEYQSFRRVDIAQIDFSVAGAIITTVSSIDPFGRDDMAVLLKDLSIAAHLWVRAVVGRKVKFHTDIL